MEGLQRDLGSMGSAISEKATDVTNAATTAMAPADSTCPPIIVDPQLDSASDFYDMENASEKNLISHVYLTRTASECELEDGFLTMRIDLVFEGKLGPKARRVDSDRPFFAYPYFVAVTNSKGEELARELFAASVTYEKDQNDVELIETIRQKLPLAPNGRVPSYQIHIGFQLTEDQLFYNASL